MPSIERDGLQIHYDDLGEGRAIVLLHGFLFSSEMWAPQIEELRKQFRVITVDFRGHGRSSLVTRPFTLYDLVSDVVAVLDACRVQRAVWMGLSMGGMVAMRAAILAPETVEAIVLLGTDAGAENPLARLRYRAMAAAARFVGLGAFLPIIGRLMFGPTSHREREDLVREWKRRFLELDLSSVRTTLRALNDRDPLGPLLHEIDAPAMVIAGEEDRALPPSRSRRIAEGLIGARLEIIPRAGHLTSLEQPELVNELLDDFLSSSAVAGDSAAAADPSTWTIDPPDEVTEGGPVENETETGAGEPADVAPEPDDQRTEADSGHEPEAPDRGESQSVIERVEEGAPGIARPPAVSTREALEDYQSVRIGRGVPAEFMLPGGKKGRERRGKRRVSPSRKLYGRVGHVGILVIDISESGAKIEHYDRRFATRSNIRLELEWEGRTLTAECEVVSCRVHRFIPGDKGSTVYQSGLLFRELSPESTTALKELVSRLVTRGLAEQVANARGIGPVLQNDMPTFRSGVVSAGGRPKEAGSEGPARLIRARETADRAGYIRCRKIGVRWEKKWTVNPAQPNDGFTVLATENKLDIESLCETWDHGDEATREFIRECARISLGLDEESKPR